MVIYRFLTGQQADNDANNDNRGGVVSAVPHVGQTVELLQTGHTGRIQKKRKKGKSCEPAVWSGGT